MLTKVGSVYFDFYYWHFVLLDIILSVWTYNTSQFDSKFDSSFTV